MRPGKKNKNAQKASYQAQEQATDEVNCQVVEP
jgi:hypothetical protein